MLNSSGGKHPTYATLTADGVAAALAMSSDIMQQRDQELEQQQQFGTHNCSSNGNGSRPGTASASAVAAAAADELSDNRLSLEFLEENGYFDMPIQVRVRAGGMQGLMPEGDSKDNGNLVSNHATRPHSPTI